LWDLLPGTRRTEITTIIRNLLADEPGVPPAALGTTDPLDLLSYSAVRPGIYARAERIVTAEEVSAVPVAAAAAYMDDTATACRNSGRTLTVISRHATAAVRTCLAREFLESKVSYVIARDDEPQSTPELLKRAFTALGTAPAACTLISASAEAIHDAASTGMNAIGYAPAPGDRERLTTAGAEATVPSLADLTLRLRARPLPN
jgi:beta-phosphoglucomutase-like phosphatase (HAD superfamily)